MGNDMALGYDQDIVAWADRQAMLLRAGRFSELDVENIAGEIEDVGKSEVRELASRMAVLLMHLLKWRFQPERQGGGWLRTVREQRKQLRLGLRQTPSLKRFLHDPEWLAAVWSDAVVKAIAETGLDLFPEECPWNFTDILNDDWLPSTREDA